MKTKARKLIAFANLSLALILIASPANTQNRNWPMEKKDIDQLISDLKSRNWGNAVVKVHSLIIPYKRGYESKVSQDAIPQEIKKALVDLLQCEMEKPNPHSAIYHGCDGCREGMLVETVCAIHSPRAIPLLKKIKSYVCLPQYGEEVAGFILSGIIDPNQSYRLSAIKALEGYTGYLSRWNALNESTRKQIRTVLINATKDESYVIRIFAIRVLVPIATKEDIPLFEKLRNGDPKQTGSPEHPYYPVRKEAVLALLSIHDPNAYKNWKIIKQIVDGKLAVPYMRWEGVTVLHKLTGIDCWYPKLATVDDIELSKWVGWWYRWWRKNRDKIESGMFEFGKMDPRSCEEIEADLLRK